MGVKITSERSVKIPEQLATLIDEYVEKVKDEYGIHKFRSRADFVEVAVRELLKKLPKPEKLSVEA